MTKLLEEAMGKVKTLQPDAQDDVARMMLAFLGDEAPLVDLTADEEASFEKSFDQARRGAFATDDRVRAIWAKHGL